MGSQCRTGRRGLESRPGRARARRLGKGSRRALLRQGHLAPTSLLGLHFHDVCMSVQEEGGAELEREWYRVVEEQFQKRNFKDT